VLDVILLNLLLLLLLALKEALQALDVFYQDLDSASAVLNLLLLLHRRLHGGCELALQLLNLQLEPVVLLVVLIETLI